MSEIDYSIQLFEGDELNLDPENDLPCGQKIRSENEIAEDGIKDFRRIARSDIHS